MFAKDMEAFNSASQTCSSSSISSTRNATTNNNGNASGCCDNNDDNNNNKRNCSEMSSGDSNIRDNVGLQLGSEDFQNFCVGAEGNTEGSSVGRGGSSRRRNGRKQRFTSARIPV